MSDRSHLSEEYGCSERVRWGLEVLEELWPYHDGPAHIVVADFNLEDHLILACIQGIDAGETLSDYPVGHPIFTATRAVLEWMLTIPERERTEWLVNY